MPIFIGTAGNDVLTGTDFDDFLDGLAGNDTLKGGKGGDTYFVDSAKDTVIEAANGGFDAVSSTAASFTLAANVETLTLAGIAAINGTGNTLANFIQGNGADNKIDGGAGNDTLNGNGGSDVLIGNAGDDTLNSGPGKGTLDGGAGNDILIDTFGDDTLKGGAGNDVYDLRAAGSTIIELANSGIDEVQATDIGFSLLNLGTVENLTLLGNGATSGLGNALANKITGNAGQNILTGLGGNDTLDGGGGADVMVGGLGTDTYVVDNVGDQTIEGAGGGKDRVFSAITFTLSNADDVEDLTLIGTAGIGGGGNTLANLITGNAGGNLLDGEDGNDTLVGGDGDDALFGSAGKDVLIGGKENDFYAVDDAGDKLIELAGQGRDTVSSALKSFTLGANFEDLVLGSGAVSGTGNSLDNGIEGQDGDNKLDGAAGNDEIVGGAGNDALIGGAGNDELDGEAGADILDGGAGNDVLRDFLGGDTLNGGAGNDRYIVFTANGTIVELANGGIDEVTAIDTSFSLAALKAVENLTLGGGALNGTGNDLSNKITGDNASNVLDGGNGNDTLDGDRGADVLIGGLGNDTYIVDDSKDQVIDGVNGGKDTVFSSVDFNLANEEIEVLVLTGSDFVEATGNGFNNLITGNGGDNVIDGGAGNDTLNGGDGGDVLTGGKGKDVMAGGTGNDIYSVDDIGDKVTEAANQGNDIVVSLLANFTLGANLEGLALQGPAINGTGNALANFIFGNLAANKLDGAGGDDDLDGDGGADTLIGGAGNDDLDGEGGFDNLDGGAGDDTLTDLSGGDTLTGGAGNDHYVVATFTTQITEFANAGIDEIETVDIGFSLAGLAQVENLTLTGVGKLNGTGNDLSNVITGNSEANTLDGGKGNDTLNGGKGGDTLIGGVGNDTYIVDNAGDDVIEAAGAGKDTVFSSVTFSLVGREIEALTLDGLGNINGIGNDFDNVIKGNAGVNVLNGDGGNDTLIAGENITIFADKLFGGEGNDTLIGSNTADSLNGGTGNDAMSGGKGDDEYFVDSAGDKITEAANAGRDEVQSSLGSFTLGANLEDLTLIGGALNGTGNSLANAITGNGLGNTLDGGAGNDELDGAAGNDLLFGGVGNDILDGGIGDDDLFGGAGDDVLEGGAFGDRLTGGAGKDVFVYRADVDLNELGIDSIADFTRGSDKIDLRDLLEAFDIDFADAFTDEHIILNTIDGNTDILFSAAGGFDSSVVLAVTEGVALAESDFLL